MIRIDLGRSEAKKNAGPDLGELLKRVRERLPKSLESKLLSKGGKGRQKNLKEFTGIAIASAVALLPYLFVGQYKSYIKNQHELQMQQYGEKEAQLNAEISKYQSFKRELDSYEKQKKLIVERLQIVRQLLEARNTPVNVFDALGQSLPEKAWLSKVEYKTMPVPLISIAGTAYANDEISDYVDKLTESTQLKDVNLESVTSVRGTREFEAKVFQVSALPVGKTGEVAAAAPAVSPSADPASAAPAISEGVSEKGP